MSTKLHVPDHPVRLARLTAHLTRIGKFHEMPPATAKERAAGGSAAATERVAGAPAPNKEEAR